MFEFDLLPRFQLECIENHGHWYVTPDGTFPSVTNILGQFSDKRYLHDWRNRVGHDEANRITEQARAYGTLIHDMCQKYMSHDDSWNQVSAVNRSIFKPVKQILDTNITKVLGVELPVWSKQLCSAGTSDLIAEWRTRRAIIDYKTSRRRMKEDSAKLVQYRLQATAYAMMIEEMYKIEVRGCVILVILQDDDPQTFTFANEPYRQEVLDIFSRDDILQFSQIGERHARPEV